MPGIFCKTRGPILAAASPTAKCRKGYRTLGDHRAGSSLLVFQVRRLDFQVERASRPSSRPAKKCPHTGPAAQRQARRPSHQCFFFSFIAALGTIVASEHLASARGRNPAARQRGWATGFVAATRFWADGSPLDHAGMCFRFTLGRFAHAVSFDCRGVWV